MSNNKMIAKLVELAQGDDLVSKAAKLRFDAEDYSDLERRIMEGHRDLAMNKARDYVQGIDQDIMLSVMEEALKPKHKFFMSDVLGDSDLFKKKAVAEAVLSGDINRIIDAYPLVQDNEMAKAAIEEMVARTKDPAKAFSLEKSLDVDPNELDIPGIDMDVRIREALDKLGGKKELIDEASVGGFSDNVTPELASMGIADDQMFGNELFDMKLRDRTRQNRAYESSIDKFLTQDGVDVSKTDRYKEAVLDEMIRLAKRQQAVDRNDSLYTRRNLHKDPVMRDKLDDRGTLPVEAIDAYKNRDPSKSEQFLDYLRKDFAKKRSENPGAKDHAIMKMLANDWVSNRKGFGMITEPKDVHPGNPRGNAKVSSSGTSAIDLAESRRDALMAKIKKAKERGDLDKVDKLQDKLADVNDEIIELRDKEKMILDAANNREAEMIMDQFEDPEVINRANPAPMTESMTWHDELDYLDDQAAKEGWKYKKTTDKETNEQLIKDAAKLGNRDRGVPLYRGSIRAEPEYVSEKEMLRSMWRKKGTEIPEEDYKKIAEPAKRVNKREELAAKALIHRKNKIRKALEEQNITFDEQTLDEIAEAPGSTYEAIDEYLFWRLHPKHSDHKYALKDEQ